MAFLEALSAARSTFEIAAVAVKARDEIKLQSAMAELREKIWAMSDMGLTQVQALHRLELEAQELRVKLAKAQDEHAQLEAKLEEKDQYQITEVCPGGWAYALISDMDKPMHGRAYFCPACYSQGKKVPMRHYQAQGQLAESWTCMADNTHRLNKPDPNRSSYVLGHDPRDWMA